MPLVVVAVVASAGFCVFRLRGIFGAHDQTSASAISDDTHPFNPKHVTYEVFGISGAIATTDYGNFIGRRVIGNGVVRDQRSINGVHAGTYGLVKSG
jgi:hypothetical protein